MIKNNLKKWAILMASGAMMAQAPGCTEQAVVIASFAQVITAGGVIYLVGRVLE